MFISSTMKVWDLIYVIIKYYEYEKEWWLITMVNEVFNLPCVKKVLRAWITIENTMWVRNHVIVIMNLLII